jgi:hypothetical protein
VLAVRLGGAGVGGGGGTNKRALSSAGDPDPPVFGPPGSGFISERYGSGSGSGSSFPFLIKVLSGLK